MEAKITWIVGVTHRNRGAPWLLWRSVSADGRSEVIYPECLEPPRSPDAGSRCAGSSPNVSASVWGEGKEAESD